MKFAIKSEQLMLLSIILIPGFYFNTIYISPTDIIIPILFLFTNRFNSKIKWLSLHLYCMFCALSVLFASIYDNTIYVNSFFKVFRIYEILMVIKIVDSSHGRYKYSSSIHRLYETILHMGIIAASIGIILFLTQSEMFRPRQLMEYDGRVLRRAEGFFGDAQTFSLIMSIIFSVALVSVFYKKNLLISYITLVVTFLAIVFSDTRAAFFGVFIALSVIVLFSIKSHHSIRVLGYIVLILFVVIIAYYSNRYVNRFFNERVIPTLSAIFSGKSERLSLVSSHRFEIWGASLDMILDRDMIYNFIGNGYKVNENVVTDNQYIYTLLTTGILGLASIIAIWYKIIKDTKRIKRSEYSYAVRLLAVIIVFTYMFFSDAMTLYRPMYFFFALLEFTGWDIEAIDANTANNSQALLVRKDRAGFDANNRNLTGHVTTRHALPPGERQP